MRTVHVSVCCNSHSGPAIYSTTITCTNAEYNDGYHYDYAKKEASELGYDGPMVAFDEHDETSSRLIAAAPDLFKALQDARDELYALAAETAGSGRYRHLDEAIAKATGKES